MLQVGICVSLPRFILGFLSWYLIRFCFNLRGYFLASRVASMPVKTQTYGFAFAIGFPFLDIFLYAVEDICLSQMFCYIGGICAQFLLRFLLSFGSPVGKMAVQSSHHHPVVLFFFQERFLEDLPIERKMLLSQAGYRLGYELQVPSEY